MERLTHNRGAGSTAMRIEAMHIPEVLLLKRDRFADSRGWFTELHNEARLRELGFDVRFVQDNLSYSAPGVLRGLHFQRNPEQGKLVTCLAGRIYDVAVDIRPRSSTFGSHVAVELTAEGGESLWVSRWLCSWVSRAWQRTRPGYLQGGSPPLSRRGGGHYLERPHDRDQVAH